LLDDFHWSDTESRALLAALVERRPERVLLIVSQRGRAGDDAALPVAWGALRIELGPLSMESLRELAAELRGCSAEELDAGECEAAALESHGHPLWFVESFGAAPTLREASLDDRLRARVRALELRRRRFVELLSLAAEPLDEVLLFELGLAGGVLSPRELDELAAERLVRRVSTTDGAALDVFHDRVREAVVATLSPATTAQLHADLARAFERRAGRDAAVAHHLAGAGEPGRASAILLRLADRAAATLAFERAAELLENVLERGRLDPRIELGVALRRAELLESAHRSVDAAEQLLRVAPRLPDREQRRVEARAAELLLASGELARGKALLGRLLARVGAPLPPTPSRTLLAMLVERASLARRGLELGAPPAFPEERAELDERAGLLRGAAIGLGMCDNLRASLYHVKAVRAALDLGDPSKASIALSIEAIFRGSTSSRARRASEPLLALAQSLAERSGDDEPHLWVDAARATRGALELRGPEAEAELARVERAFRDSPTGNTWAIDSMLLVRLLSLRLLGSVGALRLQLPELAADAARRADRYLETTLLRGGAWVCLCDDDPAAARRALERSSWVSTDEGVHVQHWIELDALGEIALYEGAGASAALELRPRLLSIERSLLSRLQRIRVLTRFLHGRLLVARAQRSGGASLSGARALAMLLAGEDVGYALAMAALLDACVAHLRGRSEARRRALERAAALGATHGLALVEASALIGLVELGHEGRRALDRASAHFERERVVAPRRLAASLLPGLVATS
jgi:eukaryotic-like serine/threonine-protein kinase